MEKNEHGILCCSVRQCGNVWCLKACQCVIVDDLGLQSAAKSADCVDTAWRHKGVNFLVCGCIRGNPKGLRSRWHLGGDWQRCVNPGTPRVIECACKGDLHYL